jgi:Holliday junction resolvase RusA-like endonuclease
MSNKGISMSSGGDLDYFEIQGIGARNGLNPMVDSWRRRFDVVPVPHSANSAQRRRFIDDVRSRIDAKFMFSGIITLTVTLFLDEQTVLESDAYGDLDNYAKMINDSLKGRDGIFIDDCQIQRLDISWIDSPACSFEVEIRAQADDEFVLKDGLALYGMRDGLYYPQAAMFWRDAEPVMMSPFDAFSGLYIWDHMVSLKRQLRHRAGQRGETRLYAFYKGRWATPLQLGYHRSRAAASGLPLIERSAWRAKAHEFNLADPERRLGQVEATLTANFRQINS